MAQYINKAALVAEIERLKENANKRGAISKHSTMVVCDEILSLIDSLKIIITCMFLFILLYIHLKIK